VHRYIKRQRTQNKSVADLQAAVAAGESAESPRIARVHSIRVLLVDDNSASQQAMRRIIMVGQCRMTISKPVLKAPVVSALEATI
jgi:hypothetical protein